MSFDYEKATVLINVYVIMLFRYKNLDTDNLFFPERAKIHNMKKNLFDFPFAMTWW